MLHAQLGGSADDLVATYDSASPGVLSSMLGQPMAGNWVLNVSARARQDVGKLRSWSIELRPAPTGVAPPNAVAAATPARTQANKPARRARAVKRPSRR